MRVCATVWLGWPSVLACTPLRIAEQLPDQVEIVDRMHGDLDARRLEQEFPELPRRGERQPGVEVDDLAEPALGDGVLQRQHHRREAQLEIDRGLELLGAADFEDVRSPRRGRCPSASGSARPRRRAVPAARRHGATGGVARSKIASSTAPLPRPSECLHAPGSASFSALALIRIVEAGDRKAGLAVGREMRVADDRPGAEGDDRPGLRAASARIASEG